MHEVRVRRLPLGKVILLALPLLVVLPYVVGTVVWNAPGSATKRTVMPVAKSFMAPYFQQNWRLFAPDVPLGVLETWYQVRYRDGAAVRTTPARSVSEVYRASGRSSIPPSIVERTVTMFEHTAVSSTVPKGQRARATLQRPSQALDADAARDWRVDKAVAQRIVSPLVDRLGLPGKPLSIMVYVTYRSSRTVEAAHGPAPLTPALQLIVNTGWMPYLDPEAR